MKARRSIALLLTVLLAASSLAIAEEPLRAPQAAAGATQSPNIADNKSLPDAPSAVASESSKGVQPARKTSMAESPTPNAAAATKAGPAFWATNGILLSSSLVNAEMIARCSPSSCQSVPDPLRNRAALYGIAVPASFGVSYLSYQLKKSKNKWWFVPAAAITAANLAYAAHASKWGR